MVVEKKSGELERKQSVADIRLISFPGRERKRKSFGKVQLILEKFKVSAVWFGPGWRSKSLDLVPLNQRKSNDPGPETFKSELRPGWWPTHFCPWER